MGDIVRVKNGYARNCLLPQGKALRASAENLGRFERERAEIEARDLARRKEAESVSGKLADVQVTILRQASESGSLYGSVNSRDVAEACSEAAVRVTRQQVAMDSAIKTLGLHEVRINVHAEVASFITVNVARSEEEAELQAQGKIVGDLAGEASREFEAELASEATLENADTEDAIENEKGDESATPEDST